MALRNYLNGAPLLTLDVGVSDSAVTLEVASTTGYPATPFVLTLERGTVNEEVCLCTAKTGNSFTVTRAWDGTTGVAHSIGAAIEHTSTAADYSEANAHVNSSADVHAQYILKSFGSAKGDLIVYTANDTPALLAVGTNEYVVIADSAQAAGMKWALIGAGSLASGIISLAKLDTSLQQSVVQKTTTGALGGITPTQGQVVHTTDNVRWVGHDGSGWTPFAYGVGKVTPSTGNPSGGANLDIWLKYSA